jgi:tetratricopeptide (TPR) repeat protein
LEKAKKPSGGLKGLLLTMGTCIAVLTAPGCATRAKRDPDQAQVRYQLAVGYFQNHRDEAAIEELQKSIEADPQNAEAYNMLGLIALKQAYDYGAQAETVSCLKGADEQSVRSEENKKLRDAEVSFRKAVELRANFPEAWNSLSAVALLLREWDEAITAAENALEGSDLRFAGLCPRQLGLGLFSQERPAERVERAVRVRVARVGVLRGRYRLAKVYVERGEVDQAVDVIEPLIADGKRCPIQEAFLLGGLLHERRKNSEKARDLFRACAEMSPRSCVADECRRYAQMIQ